MAKRKRVAQEGPPRKKLGCSRHAQEQRKTQDGEKAQAGPLADPTRDQDVEEIERPVTDLLGQHNITRSRGTTLPCLQRLDDQRLRACAQRQLHRHEQLLGSVASIM